MEKWGHPVTGIIAVAVVFVCLVGIVLTGALYLHHGQQPTPHLGPLLDETWEAEGAITPDTVVTTYDFDVDVGVSEIRFAFAIRLPSAELDGVGRLGGNHTPDPSVMLQLVRPDGNVVWQCLVDRTVGDVVTVPSPMPGTWTVTMRARGYGTDGPGAHGLPFPVRDTVRLTVTAS